MFLLLAGVAGDRWGRKRLLLAGVALFGGASVFAAYASDAATLIAARAVMGVGAAIILPLSMSVLPVIFGEHERTRAISFLAVGMALALPLGPIVGGWLLENYWWGTVFLINVPVRLIPLIAGLMVTGRPASPLTAKLGNKTVIAGGMLLLSLGFLVGAMTKGYGWTAVWLALAGLGLGAVMVPAMDTVLAVLPPGRTDTGSGVVQTLRQVGGAFGVAGLGSLLSSVYADGLPSTAPAAARESIVAAVRMGDPALVATAREAFLSGMDGVLLVRGRRPVRRGAGDPVP